MANFQDSRLVIMASGTGSTFEALAKTFPVEALIVSRSGIGAISRAEALNVPCYTIDPKEFSSLEAWDEALSQKLKTLEPKLIVLAGYLKRLGPKVLQNFGDRIINSHPSLLPAYGGKGMFGRKVHEAVLQAKESYTGVTVHSVVGEYDTGPILAQEKISVLPTDTPESLEVRVQAKEKELLVSTVGKLLGLQP